MYDGIFYFSHEVISFSMRGFDKGLRGIQSESDDEPAFKKSS